MRGARRRRLARGRGGGGGLHGGERGRVRAGRRRPPAPSLLSSPPAAGAACAAGLAGCGRHTVRPNRAGRSVGRSAARGCWPRRPTRRRSQRCARTTARPGPPLPPPPPARRQPSCLSTTRDRRRRGRLQCPRRAPPPPPSIPSPFADRLVDRWPEARRHDRLVRQRRQVHAVRHGVRLDAAGGVEQGGVAVDKRDVGGARRGDRF